MGVLNKFGKKDAGSTSLVVLIGPTKVARQARIFDFKGTAGPNSVGTLMTLELVSARTNKKSQIVDSIEVPPGSTTHSTFSRPIRITSGQLFRVCAIQNTADRMSVTLGGETEGADIDDL